MRVLALFAVCALTVVSGACGLVYEVAWVRASVPVFGVGVHAISTVLAAFLAGLGLGAGLARPLLAEWRRSPLLLYAALEAAIAVSAAFVPRLVAEVPELYAALARAAGGATLAVGAARFALCFVLFGVPAVFMGATLPVLAEAFAERGRDNSRLVGVLYGVNTLGAAAGCAAAGFVLLPALGVRATVLAAAAANLALALAAVALRRPLARAGPLLAASPAGPASRDPDADRRALDPRVLLAVAFATGFAALAYEVAWSRILLLYLQSTTHSFSVMLGLFLVGIAGGSLLYTALLGPALARRPPGASAVLLASGLAAVGLWGAATLHLQVRLEPLWIALIDLVGAHTWARIMLQKAILAAVLIVPPTFLLGWLFPLLARLLERALGSASSALGAGYVANTAGAILGSAGTAFVLLGTIGVQGALMLVAALLVSVAALLLRRHGRPGPLRATARALLAATAALVLFTPGGMLLRHYEERLSGEVLAYVEGAADTVMAVERPSGVRALRYHDGRGTSSTSIEASHLNRLMAYSSMLLKPDAKDVLVICFGVGNTAAAFSRFDIDRLDVVELSAGCLEVAPYFARSNLGVLDDPRVATHVEDGRNFLLRTGRRYDVIEIEPPSLHTDGVVYLYTREFYELARSRLKPGGVLTHWFDASQLDAFATGALLRTGLSVFPQGTLWARGGWWYTCSVNDDLPPRVDWLTAVEQFAAPAVAADLERVGSSLPNVLAAYVNGGDEMATFVESWGEAPILTDDRTLLDFHVPRLPFPTSFGGGVGYYTSVLAKRFQDAWREAGVLDQPVGATAVPRALRSPEVLCPELPEEVARSLGATP